MACRYRPVRGLRSRAVADRSGLAVPRLGGPCLGLRLGFRLQRLSGTLPAVAGSRLRCLLPALRGADRGQVDSGGALEARGGEDLDRVLPALLAGEGPDSGQSARTVHWFARVLAVPEGA